MGTSLVYSASASAGGERIHAMYAQTFLIDAGSYSVVTTGDDGGTKTLSLGGKYARVYLAQSTGTGASEADALDLLAAVESGLGVSWTVRLGTDGYVRTTYVGTGVASMDWGSAVDVAQGLGFDPADLATFVEDQTIVGSIHPLGVVYSVSLDSTDWTSTPSDSAYAMTPAGVVYGWQSGVDLFTKRVTLGHHPRTLADAQSLGSPLTPMLPPDSTHSAWTEAYGPWGGRFGWTVQEFLLTSRGHLIAAVFSNFQLFGPGRVYETGYQTPESLTQARAITPAIKDYRQRSHRMSFELSRTGAFVLA